MAPLEGLMLKNKMTDKKLQEFFEEKKSLKVPPQIQKEMEILYRLGIDFYELEFLVYMKVKEEIIMKKS